MATIQIREIPEDAYEVIRKRAGRRALARRLALDRVPAGLLLARARPLPPVPQAVPRPARCRPWRRAARLPQRSGGPRRPGRPRGPSRPAAPLGVGGLRQAPLRGTRGRAGLPVP